MQRTTAFVLMLLSLGFPLGVCLASACDPLFSQRVEPEWLMVPIEDLAHDGIPQRLQVMSEYHDAWTRCAPRTVATVFVRCDGDSKALTVLPVFNRIGCGIEYDSTRKCLRSPCHDVDYDVCGKLLDSSQTYFGDLIPIAHRVDGGQLFVRAAEIRH